MRILHSIRHVSTAARQQLISIDNATFYRHHPSSGVTPNPPLFPNLNFLLDPWAKDFWAILSASSSVRTTFLHALRGQYLCVPPKARSYPYLASEEIAAKDSRLRSPAHAIQYVGFDAERGGLGGTRTQGAYLSARYESRREETDFSLMDYLSGHTELNAADDMIQHPPQELLDRVIQDLNLAELVEMPVSNLSNGQTRRARIAKALLSGPEVLLLDGPFMGLDPPTVEHLSPLLHRLAKARAPRIVLSLKSDNVIPSWITHLGFLGDDFTVQAQGLKRDVFQYISNEYYKSTMKSNFQIYKERKVDSTPAWLSLRDVGRELDANRYLPKPKVRRAQMIAVDETKVEKMSIDGFPEVDVTTHEQGSPVVEMEGVQVRYGDKCVLGDWQQERKPRPGLYWKVFQGQRWGVFGPNGSGKTTLLALLTSDHPQSYSAPMKLFGRTRLPQDGKPGLSLWEIQSRLGHSSPEVHTYFPRNISVRRAVESAWADTPKSRAKLTHEADMKVDHALRWFQAEIMPSIGPTWQQRDEVTRLVDPFVVRSDVRFRQKATVNLIKDELRGHDEHPGIGLDWADDTLFGEVSFSAQRVLLFLRAIIRNPEFVVLDEAFSGMDESTRDKCMLFLSYGEERTRKAIHVPPSSETIAGLGISLTGGPDRAVESDVSRLGLAQLGGLKPHQTLLVVSHNPAEVPGCVREWICLPDTGEGKAPRMGRLDGPLSLRKERWRQIWGVE